MANERVLVTGATGMIGSAVVARLLVSGFTVRAYVHEASIPKLKKHGRLETAAGDMRDGGKLTEAMHGVDYVIHLAACKSDEPESERVNVGGASNLIAACKAHPVKRIVNVSTQSVKLSTKGTYAHTKSSADAMFAASGLSVTTVLPSVVYGTADQGIFGSLLKFIKLPVVPVIGSGEALFWPIHRADLAHALETLMKHPDAAGKTYDAGGPDGISFNALVDELLRRQGLRKPKFHIPSPVAMLIASCITWMKRPPITKSNVLGADEKLTVDLPPFFRDIGFTPRSLKEGLDELLGPSSEEDREAKALLRYAMNDRSWEPDPATVALYRRACERHEINPLHHVEPGVLSGWKLGALDAVTRLLKPRSQIQRKLLIAGAIVESSPASAKRLLPKNRSIPALIVVVAVSGIRAILKLAAGLLLCLHPRFLRRNAGL